MKELIALFSVLAALIFMGVAQNQPPIEPIPVSGVANILDFGAVPNDPSQPCDDALKEARKHSSHVHFPNVDSKATTKYYFENDYTQKVSELWTGDGKGYAAGGTALLDVTPTADKGFITTNRSTIRDLCIIGHADRLGHGIELNPFSTVSNVEVRYFKHGLVSWNNWQGLIERSTFRNNDEYGVYFKKQGGGRNNIVTVRDCDMALNRFGIVMEGNNRMIAVESCTIQGNSEGGFLQRGNNASTGCLLAKNWFEHNSGIHLHVNGRAGGLQIIGNYFVTSGQSRNDTAIQLDAMTASGGAPFISRAEMRSNYFYNSGNLSPGDILMGIRVMDTYMPDSGGTMVGPYSTGSPPRIVPNYLPTN